MASDYLGISPDTLYKYASEGFVPAFKLGNRWRFKRSRLDEWMDQQSTQGAQPRKPEPQARGSAAQKAAVGHSASEKGNQRGPLAFLAEMVSEDHQQNPSGDK